jgi:small subunit ribosomal protein S20
MANIKSAKKRILTNEKAREQNRKYRSRMRTAIKRLRTAIDGGEADQAKDLLPGTLKVIDETAQKGVIHDNTAARYKSRLSQAVAGLSS